MARTLPKLDRKGRLRPEDRKAHPKLFELRERFERVSRNAGYGRSRRPVGARSDRRSGRRSGGRFAKGRTLGLLAIALSALVTILSLA